MTDPKDQHIKELQDLLAAEKVRSDVLRRHIMQLQEALQRIADIAEEAQL